jgi:hypothetical protein
MPRPSLHEKYSFRSRLVELAGATLLLSIGVVLMFFPLVSMTLDGVLDRTIKTMQEEKEKEATTIARLMVLELSLLHTLLEVSPTVDKEIDQRIKLLLWTKVTFNEVIEGIELIHAPADSEGRYLTYEYYRRDAPELEPMRGPQKVMKKISGPEQELVNVINNELKVDKTLEESVNRGPKKEGDMLQRYLPVHVLGPEVGAIYWGVAKIGIENNSIRQLMLLQNREQQRLNRNIWLEIILSLVVSGLLAISLLYFWARRLTDPLRKLSSLAGSLNTGQLQEFDLWIDNLKRVNPRGQQEATLFQQTLIKLGIALQRVSQGMVDSQRQACLGRITSGIIPALLECSAKLQELFPPLSQLGQDQQKISSGSPASLPEAYLQLEKLTGYLQDLQITQSTTEKKWKAFDLTPGLHRVWRLTTLGLSGEVALQIKIDDLPLVFGSPQELEQAMLYLLEYVCIQLAGGGALTLAALPTSSQRLKIALTFAGPLVMPERYRYVLMPFQAPLTTSISLGPPVAAAIVAKHGGSLIIQAAEEDRMVFSLDIPALPFDHTKIEIVQDPPIPLSGKDEGEG